MKTKLSLLYVFILLIGTSGCTLQMGVKSNGIGYCPGPPSSNSSSTSPRHRKNPLSPVTVEIAVGEGG